MTSCYRTLRTQRTPSAPEASGEARRKGRERGGLHACPHFVPCNVPLSSILTAPLHDPGADDGSARIRSAMPDDDEAQPARGKGDGIPISWLLVLVVGPASVLTAVGSRARLAARAMTRRSMTQTPSISLGHTLPPTTAITDYAFGLGWCSYTAESL